MGAIWYLGKSDHINRDYIKRLLLYCYLNSKKSFSKIKKENSFSNFWQNILMRLTFAAIG
jgi:hypothetical protein